MFTVNVTVNFSFANSKTHAILVFMDDKKRFAKLSWTILEHKYRYYILDFPVVEDFEYDLLEREYEALAKKLSLDPTATNMVGFDLNRPSCQAVIEKLRLKQPKKPVKKDKK